MNRLALLAAYMGMWGRMQRTTVAAVLAAWDTVGGFDDDAAERFVTQAVQISHAGQAYAVTLVDALIGEMLQEPSPGLDPATLTGANLRAGATPETVYQRAIVTARFAISEGKSPTEALAAGRARAGDLAATDVSLAQRAAMDETTRRDSRIVGYRRTLTGRSCMFCATASSQRYHDGQLMPIHGRCDCGVAPIIGNSDPGRVANTNLLRTLKQQGGSKYWQDRGFVDIDDDGRFLVKAAGADDPVPLKIATRQHGELGPVLVDARHTFTGPGGIAA